VLVILFSVVFPTLKMLALAASLFRPALLRTSRFVKVLAFELSKWSMADVMVLAIFMSFVAFNGVIGSAFDGCARCERATGADPDECIEDPAWLLFVHWILRGQHPAVEKAAARDWFQFRLWIKLESPSVLRARPGLSRAPSKRPQGLKPESFCSGYGTTKVVP